MSRWYYEFGEEQLGPISQAELIHFIKAGALDKDTWVWNKKQEQWQQIGELEELIEFLPAPPDSLVKKVCRWFKALFS